MNAAYLIPYNRIAVAIAEEFEDKWNFPNCIGAMDGKHINIKQPKNSGFYFFNYKGTFSIVLLALVDANYKFIYVDVGCNGRINDGGVFRNASLSTATVENVLYIPPPRNVRGLLLPYVIVADDAFPLKENLVKPYPLRNLSTEHRVTNYRISRAREVSENAFGIMANRFRIFLSTIQLSPDNVEKIVLASCILHNFLRDKASPKYTPPASLDREDIESGEIHLGEWRSQASMTSVNVAGRNACTKNAKEIRDRFSFYYNSSEGSVPWQDRFI